MSVQLAGPPALVQFYMRGQRVLGIGSTNKGEVIFVPSGLVTDGS